jgi:hypothetical protein
MPVRLVLATPGYLNEVIGKYYSRDAAKAELAAGPNKIATAPAATAVAAPTNQYQPPKAPKSIYNLSPEERAELKKRRLTTCFVAFNFTFMAVIFGLYIGFNRYFTAHPILSIFGAVAAGGVAAGITYIVAELKRG